MHREPSDDRLKFTPDFLDFFSDRHASSHAAFFIDRVKPGMTILDCGCGPGSITLDFAELVSPAKAVGIDIEAVQIDRAKAFRAARGLSNAEFLQADINALPFENDAFDLAFTHGVIEYFPDPVRAFGEIRRVLKEGGVLGARHGDWGGFLLSGADEFTREGMSLFVRLMEENGGDPYFGRNQIVCLRKAGFTRTVLSASYDCWTPTPEIARRAGRFMEIYFKSEEFVGPVLELIGGEHCMPSQM